MDTKTLVAELGRPEAFAAPAEGIEFRETHISLLCFAGQRVYKLKRPVDLGFLDFTTLAAREHFCHEEVRLNARLAPEVYLGVVPIWRGADGHLRVGSTEHPPSPAPTQAEVVEWAVEMRRLPEHGMLAGLLERGEIDNQRIEQLVALLTDFHASAATGPGVDEHGSPEAIEANERENFEQLETFAEGLVTPLALSFLSERRLGWLDRHRPLLERRVRERRIREGHGDLHAGNVCFVPSAQGERVVAYDCIEFNRRFRCGDVAADLAFLTMDFDQRGCPGFSSYLERGYARAADDGELRELGPFYKGYRAIVRGKVAAMASVAEGLGPERRAELRAEAMRYLQLATAYELPPTLVLTCGLPASGKSWIARRLGGALRAVVLRSDVRRKVLAGLPPHGHAPVAWGAGPYGPEAKRDVYRSLLGDALRNLRYGHSVVVDASFSERAVRRTFVDAAERLGLAYHVVHVTAPESLARQRLARRAHDPDEASDADLAIYERARECFEPPDEVPAGALVEVVSGDGPAEQASATVLDALIRRPPPHDGPTHSLRARLRT